MHRIRSIKTIKWGYFTLALYLCAFGIALLLRDDPAPAKITNAVGGTLLLFGAVNIGGFFAKDLYRLVFQHGFATGIIAGLFGIFLLASPAVRFEILCIVFGLVTLTDAATKIEMALDAKAFGLRSWLAVLFTGILAGLAGALLVIYPFLGMPVTVRLIGLAVAALGILSLLSALFMIKAPTRIHPLAAALEEKSPYGL